VVERAVAQDIALSAFEDTEGSSVLVVYLVNLRLLTAHGLWTKPTGVGGGTAVIADAQIRHTHCARGLGHLSDGGLAVAPCAVDMQDALEVGFGDEIRQRFLARHLELTTILTQFRRYVFHAEDAVQVSLVLAGDLLVALPDAVLADL